MVGIAAGWNHTACWTSEKGEAWAWGANHCMQVGNSSKEHALNPVRILADFPLSVHPSWFANSLQQLNDLDAKVRTQVGGKYRLVTTRDVVDEVIRPFTAGVANRGYACLLNKNKLLPAEAFVSHCWDEAFGVFVTSVNEVFQQFQKMPNLWICFLALSQSGRLRTARRPGLKPAEAPFARVMRRCRTVLLVRNAQNDVYKRLWCMYELHTAHQLGFMSQQGRFLVHGPNPPLYTKKREVILLDCQTSEPEDRDWLLDDLSRRPGLLEEAQEMASTVHRTFFR